MARLTAEQRDEQLDEAQFLIDEGRVRTWGELGKHFGISRQAAQARFGRGYGLVLPDVTYEPMERVTLGLPKSVLASLEKKAGGNRTAYIRSVLEAVARSA